MISLTTDLHSRSNIYQGCNSRNYKPSKHVSEKNENTYWKPTGNIICKTNSIIAYDPNLIAKNISPLTFYKPKHMLQENDTTEFFEQLSNNSSCNKSYLKSSSTCSLSSSSSLQGPVLSFHNVSYNVKIRKFKKFKWSVETKNVLDDVSGIFKPGMSAILGPTGCGKSTLLDILSGRKKQKQFNEQILVDGCKEAHSLKCAAGYVVQDDMIMGTLTVRENLMFSANIRLPQSISHAQKADIVDGIIGQLGLTKCAQTKIGTDFIRGVSGGERKRTCIGMELVVSPAILFLDEPTTGLDACTANSVMSLLHRLSRNGLTVIFSIHQPRYSIFKLFDTIMLLGAGKVVYHGPACKALDFFYDQNYQCEPHNNPPDFFLDVVNGEIPSSRSSPYCSNASVATFSNNCGEYFSHLNYLFDILLDVNFYKNKPSKNKSMESQKSNESDKDYCTSFISQLIYVSKRTAVNVLRNPASSIAQITLTLFFAFLTGLLYYKMTIDANKDIQNRAGAFFFIVMIQMFGNISAVELFLKERSLFIHENKSGYYRVSVYFVSKIFCDLVPLRLLPVVLFSIITYFMLNLQLVVSKFFIYLLNLFLTTFVSALMAFVISASVGVLALANMLVGLVMILMMLFGGLLLNSVSIPRWLKWLEYFSFIRYSYKTLLINELKDMQFNIYDNGQIIANSTTVANNFLKEQGVAYESDWDLWQNLFALGISIVILGILCYVQLRFMVRNR
ncbi:hypothetical protein HELRODRAFT_97247 [Helobdella robusta]|uniref:ABC transporter domain-containing protein n=1 Tax=Helobdella robusta TaxID=6412 RepID=T1G9G2_HELRO|nr:hypothetical protein HELRODRAFT_97247 [Helobdella robusta]ESO09919.1 hypothetical protein HELRODRAFT_97247 [Helobdella robusta]